MPKRKKDEHGGDERWLLTYADLITLLLGLFVILWSMGRADLEKYRHLAEAMKQVFGGNQNLPTLMQGVPPIGGGMGPYEDLEGGAYPDTSEAYLTARLNEVLEQISDITGEISVEIEQRGVVVHLTESVLFTLGKADLRNESKIVLNEIAPVLLKSGRPIMIEGHTDNLPINTWQFPSNWQLSAARSANVVHFLTQSCAIPGAQISSSAYADQHPIDTNKTPDGRQRNRRVDIVFLKGKWKELDQTRRYSEDEPALTSHIPD